MVKGEGVWGGVERRGRLSLELEVITWTNKILKNLIVKVTRTGMIEVKFNCG